VIEGLFGLRSRTELVDQTNPHHIVPLEIQHEAPVAQVCTRVRVRPGIPGHAPDRRLDVALEAQLHAWPRLPLFGHQPVVFGFVLPELPPHGFHSPQRRMAGSFRPLLRRHR
jgi:hypothetical protein